jgi:genome maintenance exonuclease 1
VFTHSNLITPVELEVKNTPKGRFYVSPTGNVYPSITTLLGQKEKPWLEDWRNSLGSERADKETKRAAGRGEAVHSMIEKFLKNDLTPTLNYLPEHIAEFNSTKLRLKKSVNNILLQESSLYSDTLKVAGRVDCVGEWDGALSIIDFKTSTNNKTQSMVEDYYLQATAYGLMFHEMFNIQIDNIVIIMSVEKGIVPLVFKQDLAMWISPLVQRINNYYSKNEGYNYGK